jgi:hypothetical protein
MMLGVTLGPIKKDKLWFFGHPGMGQRASGGRQFLEHDAGTPFYTPDNSRRPTDFSGMNPRPSG